MKNYKEGIIRNELNIIWARAWEEIPEKTTTLYSNNTLECIYHPHPNEPYNGDVEITFKKNGIKKTVTTKASMLEERLAYCPDTALSYYESIAK